MQEEQARLVVEEVIVQARHRDFLRLQHPDHGIHFNGEQDEVANDCRLAGAGRLAVDRGREARLLDGGISTPIVWIDSAGGTPIWSIRPFTASYAAIHCAMEAYDV